MTKDTQPFAKPRAGREARRATVGRAVLNALAGRFRLGGFLLLVLLVVSPAATAFCAAEAALPDAKTVLQGVLQRADKDDENDRLFERRYSYNHTETTECRNGRGVLKKTESTESHHRAGDPATDEPKPVDAPPKKKGKASAKGEKKAPLQLDEELFKRFQFEVTGRETIEGRAALKLVFNPLRNQPEHSLADRFISRIAGQAWVDEADYSLVKLSFHMTEPVKVIGGLAGLVRALNFQLERTRTADGLWFTRQTTWHLEAREVFVNHIVDFREETSDVQPASQATGASAANP
jgi:hypothetical protein